MNQQSNTNGQQANAQPGFFSRAVAATVAHIANNRAKYGVALGALVGVGSSVAVDAYRNRT